MCIAARTSSEVVPGHRRLQRPGVAGHDPTPGLKRIDELCMAALPLKTKQLEPSPQAEDPHQGMDRHHRS